MINFIFVKRKQLISEVQLKLMLWNDRLKDYKTPKKLN